MFPNTLLNMITSHEYQKGFIAGFLAARARARSAPANETPGQTNSHHNQLFEDLRSSFEEIIVRAIASGSLECGTSLLQAKLDFGNVLREERLEYEAKELNLVNRSEDEERIGIAAHVYAVQKAEMDRMEEKRAKTETETETRVQESPGSSQESDDPRRQKEGLDKEITRLRLELSRFLSLSEGMDTQRKIMLAKEEQGKMWRAEMERQRAELEKLRAEQVGTEAELKKNEEYERTEEPRISGDEEKTVESQVCAGSQAKFLLTRARLVKKNRRPDIEAQHRKKEMDKSDTARMKEMSDNVDIMRKELRKEELVMKYQKRWDESGRDA